jgi:hypothetical protein
VSFISSSIAVSGSAVQFDPLNAWCLFAGGRVLPHRALAPRDPGQLVHCLACIVADGAERCAEVT